MGRAHETLAGGDARILYADDDLYIMQRPGWDGKPGLIFALNNRGDRRNGTWVTTQWRNIVFTPVAWRSATDLSRPADQWAHADGRMHIWTPPRGYVVYGPGV